MARCRESVSRLPFGIALSVMIRLTVFTPISALQFEWGNATDDRRWWTPHSFRNWHVAAAVNSGPPSVAHCAPQAVNQAFRSLSRSFDNGPVGVAIYHDEVVDPLVVEEVCTDALEGVSWGNSW